MEKGIKPEFIELDGYILINSLNSAKGVISLSITSPFYTNYVDLVHYINKDTPFENSLKARHVPFMTIAKCHIKYEIEEDKYQERRNSNETSYSI